MFNKNYIIIAIIALVVFGGGIFFYVFSGNKTTTVSAPTSTKGELTRSLAKQILLEEYKDEPRILDAGYDEYWGGYLMIGSVDTLKGKALSDRGLVSEINDSGLLTYMFDFTEEGKKYLTVPNYVAYPGKDSKDVGVVLGYFKNLEVTGIIKNGETQAIVQFEIEYELTPFGEVLKPDLVKMKSESVFSLYDDGWRIGLGLGGN